MPLNIRSETVNRLAKKLAARTRLNKTEAVKLALENELRRLQRKTPLRIRVRPLQQRLLRAPATGREAQKDFYDELSGESRCSSTLPRSSRSLPASRRPTR